MHVYGLVSLYICIMRWQLSYYVSPQISRKENLSSKIFFHCINFFMLFTHDYNISHQALSLHIALQINSQTRELWSLRKLLNHKKYAQSLFWNHLCLQNDNFGYILQHRWQFGDKFTYKVISIITSKIKPN